MGWDANSSIFSGMVDLVVGGFGSLCLFTVGLLAGGPVRPAHQGHGHQAYCLRCREKTWVRAPKVGYTQNGRRIVKGTCARCGTRVNRFLPQDA